MTPASDIALLLKKKLTPQTSQSQDVFNFIIAFYEANSCGPTMEEVREALSIMYEREVPKSGVYYSLKWLHKRNKIELISGKNKRTATRIIVKRAIWVFRGHSNVHLISSEKWKE